MADFNAVVWIRICDIGYKREAENANAKLTRDGHFMSG